MKLWLDDCRDPVEHGFVGWTWVKTYEEAIEALKTGTVEIASLDHDLAGCSIGIICAECLTHVENFEDYLQLASLGCPHGPKTGYDVVCWMEENDVWPPQGVRVHSHNPAGEGWSRSVRTCLSFLGSTEIVDEGSCSLSGPEFDSPRVHQIGWGFVPGSLYRALGLWAERSGGPELDSTGNVGAAGDNEQVSTLTAHTINAETQALPMAA